MKPLLRALPMLVLSSALGAAEPAPAPAAPAPAAAPAAPAGTQARAGEAGNTDGPAGAPSDEAEATRKANDRFKPSEKISEDLSVSFPSDI